jgi:hypothetical protein
MIISAMITSSVNNRMSVLPQKVSDYYHENQARNFSMGLVDQAIEELKSNQNWEGIMVEDTLTKGRGTATLRTYTVDSKSYPAEHGVGVWDEHKVLLYSESTFEGYTVITEVLMEKKSFSQYAYYSNSEYTPWGGRMDFLSTDTLRGPIHSNDALNIRGTPVFEGRVTSPHEWIARSWDANPQFAGGANFNAPSKPLPTSADIQHIEDAAADSGLKFDYRIEVDLYTQLSGRDTLQMARIRETDAAETYWNAWQTYNVSNTNGVISSPSRIDIYGEVSGRVTVHSGLLIEIDGDLRYYDDPRTNPKARNMLGLVSEGDIRVDSRAHSYEGTRDVDIQANIMALGSMFYAEDYWGADLGSINLYGGLVQGNKGPVSIRYTDGRIFRGFDRNYHYDPRFNEDAPPHYPRETIYSVVYWKDDIVRKPKSSFDAISNSKNHSYTLSFAVFLPWGL